MKKIHILSTILLCISNRSYVLAKSQLKEW